jgi:protein-L-isoaspartate(D-aspartate) O-methyltransferase
MDPGRDILLAELRALVPDERVLAAIAAVPREAFVPEELRSRAYENHALPIGHGQTISQPLVVARMCSLLSLGDHDRVLEVGTGSGYHAAVLARLCGHVFGVEIDAQLAHAAGERLRAIGVTNVTVLARDGSHGLEEHAPYDAISVAAATPAGALAGLEVQLKRGGRLVAPVADRGHERLVLVRRTRRGFRRRVLEPVRFVPLTGDAG